jgi:hypothetical protein
MQYAGLGGNPSAMGQFGNVGGGRSAGDGGVHSGGAPYHKPKLVDEAPAPAGFSFERVKKVQCENVQYVVSAECMEYEYFVHHCKQLLEDATTLTLDDDAAAVVQAFNEATAVEVLWLKYNQLKKTDAPHVVAACPWAGGGYKMFKVDKMYVVNPGGDIFEVLDSKAWAWTFKILLKCTVDNVACAALISVTRKPKTVLYLTEKDNARVMQIEYGRIVGSSFTPQLKVYVGGGDNLFNSSKWARMRTARAPVDEEEREEEREDEERGEPVLQHKYTFQNVEDRICWLRPRPKKEGVWEPLANFAIDEVLAIYEFEDRDLIPWMRLKVHAVFGDGETLCAKPEQPLKIADGFDGLLEAEVVVPYDVEDKQVSGYFSKVSSYLLCHKTMKAEHLIALFDTMSKPGVTQVVTTFGRQDASDLFVMGNCCFKRGAILSHEEAGVGLLPHIFNSKDAVLKWPLKTWPKILRVPQAWVRYTFLTDFWRQILPGQFLNNTLQAKATFALGVMHLQCSKFWAGQAIGSMVATGWLKSTAPNTGKTEAVLMGNALVGLLHKGVTMGSCSSLPAVVHRLSKQRDLSLFLDEIATKVSVDGEKSKKIKDIVHMCANGSSREVCGKTETPLTTFVGTSNIVVNEGDDAFLQRLLLILFEPLKTAGVDNDSTRALRWEKSKDMLSCLAPDLEQLLWNGKLDREALTDWCTYMNKATSAVYSRNANLWGFLGYFMTMLEAMAQGDTPDLDLVMEYLCHQVVRQNYQATKHSAMINQFLLALNDCRTSASANPLTAEDRCIHWHNYRTTERPEGIFTPNLAFTAVRIDAVCNVIKRVLNLTFKPEEVRRAVEETEWACFGRARFFKVAELGFPIFKLCLDEATSTEMRVPLPEEELLAGQVTLMRCAFFQTAKVNAIITEVDNVMRDAVDYKAIVITSTKPGYGDYNFFDSVTLRTPWFGWRAMQSTSFAPYCGASNDMDSVCDCDYNVGVKKLTADEGYGSVRDCFDPIELVQHYFYKLEPKHLPPPLRLNPYLFRNGPNDYKMPADARSVHFEAGLIDDYEDPSPPTPNGRDNLRSGGSGVRQPLTPSSIRSSDNGSLSGSGKKRKIVRAHTLTHALPATKKGRSLLHTGPRPAERRPRRPVERRPRRPHGVLLRVRHRDLLPQAALRLLRAQGARARRGGGEPLGEGLGHVGHLALVDLERLPLLGLRLRLDDLRELGLVELDRVLCHDVHDRLRDELVLVQRDFDLRMAGFARCGVCERGHVAIAGEDRSEHAD